MNITRYLTMFAITFLLGIIFIIVALQNPIDREYRALLGDIMSVNEFISEKEAFTYFPELEDLKNDIQNYKHKYYNFQESTKGNNIADKEKNMELLTQISSLNKMKTKIHQSMEELKAKMKTKKKNIDDCSVVYTFSGVR